MVDAVAAMPPMTGVAGGVISCIVLPMAGFGHFAHVAHFLTRRMDVPAQCLGFVLVMFLFVMLLFVL
jgi:hypothetical protein